MFFLFISNLFLVCLFPFFVSFWVFFLAFREERKGGREERGKIYKRRKGDLDKKTNIMMIIIIIIVIIIKGDNLEKNSK